MNNPPFFITGLPRSRTGWLSVFLTHGGVTCFHDFSANFEGYEEFSGSVALMAEFGKVGVSDSGILFFDPVQIRRDFPGCKIAVVSRGLDDCRKSFERTWKKRADFQQWYRLSCRLTNWRLNADFIINFEDLDDADAAERLCKTVGVQFCMLRFFSMRKMRIDHVPEKYLADLPAKKRELFEKLPPG